MVVPVPAGELDRVEGQSVRHERRLGIPIRLMPMHDRSYNCGGILQGRKRGSLTRVGVVGCGLMGSGIAEVAARAGFDVRVLEVNPESARTGRRRIETSLGRAEQAGKLSEADHESALRRLSYTTDLDELTDREIVVEAVPELEQAKLGVFDAMNKVLEHQDALLASNTSSIPIMKLAMATQRPENVIGVHFFNPVPVLGLVELVPSLLTSKETVGRAEQFALDLGKQVIHSPDRAGFIVNALLIPYLLSAIRMMESGFATAEEIDLGMTVGCAHPLGPLALADLIGLDTTMAIAESLYAEFREPLYAPAPLLMRMVDAGLLGRKSGRGFYDHSGR